MTGAHAILVAAAAVAACLAGTVSVPMMISDMDKASDTSASAHRIGDQVAQAKSMEQEAQAGGQLKELRDQIPATADLGQFAASLQTAAVDVGAHWVAGTQKPLAARDATDPDLIRYQVQVSLRADLKTAAAFVARVQQGARTTQVTAMSVAGEHTEVTFVVLSRPDPASGGHA